MNYRTAREILAEAIENLDEATMNSMGLFMGKKSKPAAKKPTKVNKAEKFTKVKKARKDFQGLHSKYWETDGRPV